MLESMVSIIIVRAVKRENCEVTNYRVHIETYREYCNHQTRKRENCKLTVIIGCTTILRGIVL